MQTRAFEMSAQKSFFVLLEFGESKKRITVPNCDTDVRPKELLDTLEGHLKRVTESWGNVHITEIFPRMRRICGCHWSSGDWQWGPFESCTIASSREKVTYNLMINYHNFIYLGQLRFLFSSSYYSEISMLWNFWSCPLPSILWPCPLHISIYKLAG